MSDALDDLAASLSDGEALRAALGGPFRRAIRLHPRRGRPSGWGALEPVPWHAAGRFHDAGIDPATRLDYHTGLAWPQDAASQLPVALLAPRPGETVVDCCAAPGSKATQGALALHDEGLLICCDASAPRRRVLAETLARQGAACGLVCPLPVGALAERHPGCADAVLVDAPCSGHQPRSRRQVARMAERQAALLRAAAGLVRPGGRLVYATCTPYPGEDEAVVLAFLDRADGWRVEPVEAPGCDRDLEDLGAVRVWPQRQGTEPFFACLLRAPGEGAARPPLGDLPEPFAGEPPHRPEGWHVWRRGGLVLAGTALAAAAALPSQARGLVLGRLRGAELVLDPWGAQALIERGAPARTVDHATACALWGGGTGDGLVRGELLRTEHGAPLGVSDGRGLRLPSRLRREGLV